MIKRVRTCSELKTRRANFLIKPSVYDNFSKIAYVKGLSVNGLIGDILENYVCENKSFVEKYDEEVGANEED